MTSMNWTDDECMDEILDMVQGLVFLDEQQKEAELAREQMLTSARKIMDLQRRMSDIAHELGHTEPALNMDVPAFCEIELIANSEHEERVQAGSEQMLRSLIMGYMNTVTGGPGDAPWTAETLHSAFTRARPGHPFTTAQLGVVLAEPPKVAGSAPPLSPLEVVAESIQTSGYDDQTKALYWQVALMVHGPDSSSMTD